VCKVIEFPSLLVYQNQFSGRLSIDPEPARRVSGGLARRVCGGLEGWPVDHFMAPLFT